MGYFHGFRTVGYGRSQLLVVACLFAASMALSGCGVMANSKPIQTGTPIAEIHFGPIVGLGRGMAITIYDNEKCSRDGFARYKTIGTFLGSDVDVEIPAGKQIFVTLEENKPDPSKCGGPGVCISTCRSKVAFEPKEGGKYSAQMLTAEGKCGAIVFEIKNGHKDLVADQTHPKMCL
jgi:ferredoxin